MFSVLYFSDIDIFKNGSKFNDFLKLKTILTDFIYIICITLPLQRRKNGATMHRKH